MNALYRRMSCSRASISGVQIQNWRLLDSNAENVIPASVGSLAAGAAVPDAHLDLGWTELTGAAAAVELGIVLEEPGHATDPTPTWRP